MTGADVRPSVHLSIDVPDLEAGLTFYGVVCDFRETARPFPTMAVLDGNNVTVCLHAKPAGSPSSADGPPRDYARHWTPVHLDLHVEDFDGTLDRITAGGGRIERSFRDTGPRLAAFCCDPFGNGFCVIGPRREDGVERDRTTG
jgi:predicted enzyme related to lactoylglutathione lyase